MVEPKVLIWDIESTNLKATFGTILCIGWKWLGQKTIHIPTIIETSKGGMLDDHGLVKNFAEVYNEADYHVTHYGPRFDLPMVQSKLIKYGEPPLPPKLAIDTWRVARNNLQLHSNRLGSLAEFLGVEHEKSPIRFDQWLKAAFGDRAALREVKEHCRLDVIVLEEVFIKLRPWIREEPVRHLFVSTPDMACTSCGSERLQRRGFHISRTRRYQRYQCQDCGKWVRAVHCEKVAPPRLIGGY
jgi:uncharacterized protein YprB with RNaseH-like and TPR domain